MQHPHVSQLTHQLQCIIRRLGANMIVKKEKPFPGLFCHGGHETIGPLSKFPIAVIIVELFLHVTGAPPFGVSSVETNIEELGIGYHIESGKQIRQIRTQMVTDLMMEQKSAAAMIPFSNHMVLCLS